MSRCWKFAGVVALLAAVAVAIPVASSADTSASGNLTRARTEAAHLLTLLHVPPGAVELTSEPRVLSAPSFQEANPNLVDAHHWWKVHGKAANVLAYVDAHKPRGARLTTSGSGGPDPVYRMKSFSLAPTPGVLSQRVLAASVVQVSSSTTLLRTDGEAVWVVPRPASEQLPAGIGEIDITSTSFTTRAQIVSLKVTNGAEVGQIVKWVDALAIAQPGVINCPLLNGPTVTFVFRTAERARLALASGMDFHGSSGACNALDLRIGGRSEPPLVGDLFERVQRLLGARFERTGQGSGGPTRDAGHAPPRPADRVRTLDALR